MRKIEVSSLIRYLSIMNNGELVYYEGGLRKPYKNIVAAGSFVAECAA